MISITSAPEAPPPRIRIVDSRGREVETVRIGDKLTFRIEIPDDSKCNALTFQFHTAVNIEFMVLWHVTPLQRYQCFGGNFCLHVQR
jgi:hypothetical protein